MNVRGRARRALRPALERVEGRELLSGLMVALAAKTSTPSAASLLQAEIGAASTGNGNTGGVGNGNGLTNNSNTPLLGSGTPTPQELARETFRAGFSGRDYVGPGRFSDQGTTYFYRGIGGSNMFLHGDFDMAVITPTDPTKPFLGLAVLNDKSTNSSGVLAFDLTGDRNSVDSQGRPTHLTATGDPNIYAGAFYVQAADVSVDIRYGANNAATVTFHGLVYTTGLTNPLVNQDLYARQGRPLRFRGH
jgi:hypothetical protein